MFHVPVPKKIVERLLVEMPVVRRGLAGLEKFLAPFASRFVTGVSRLEAEFLPILKSILDDVARVFGPLLFRNEDAQEAFVSYWRHLTATFIVHYSIALHVILLSALLVGVFVGRPLLVAYVFKRSVKVFVSFNRALESVADDLQRTLESEGVATTRIAYKVGAPHQEIVDAVSQGIKGSNAFLCIPGASATFVDSEVLAASTGGKALIFLLSERAGTLPNTADKRYPIFKLEKTHAENFRPLVRFVRYVGRDFASVAALVVRSLRSSTDFFAASARGRSVLALTLIAAVGFCYVDVYQRGHAVLALAKEPGARAAAILANTSFFFIIGITAVLTAEYVAVVSLNRWKQSRTQKRATLEVAAATFTRDDWLGMVPGLDRGSSMFNCMFEGTPLAHHERVPTSGEVAPGADARRPASG